jgi:putative endonuclease
MPGYVYMLSNRRHGTLYVGVTNDIVRRVHEHRTGAVDGFTKRHGLHRLAFFETHETVPLAIEREKQLKRWKRDWKVRLIEETNPDWDDLYPGLTR